MRYTHFVICAAVAFATIGVLISATRADVGAASNTPITAFTVSNVKQAIADAGAEFIATTKAVNSGNQGIRFRHNGRFYYAWIQCYENLGCTGLELTAEFDTSKVTIPVETINTYNLGNVDGKAMFDPVAPPQVRTARFLQAYGGIGPKNVAFEMTNFFDRTDGFLAHLRNANVIASGAPGFTQAGGAVSDGLTARPHSKAAGE